MVDRKPLSNRQLQVLWVSAFVVGAVYVWIADTFGKTFDGHITLLHWAVALLAGWSAWSGHSVRHKLKAKAMAESSGGNELIAARRWSVAQVVPLIYAHAVVLWGVLARMVLGCPRSFAAPFYVVGLVLLIAWKPGKQPVPTTP